MSIGTSLRAAHWPLLDLPARDKHLILLKETSGADKTRERPSYQGKREVLKGAGTPPKNLSEALSSRGHGPHTPCSSPIPGVP